MSLVKYALQKAHYLNLRKKDLKASVWNNEQGRSDPDFILT